jgi:hypothetical protein
MYVLEISSQPYCGRDTVSKLANHLIAGLEHLAHTNRVVRCLVVVRECLLINHHVRGNPCETRLAKTRGANGDLRQNRGIHRVKDDGIAAFVTLPTQSDMAHPLRTRRTCMFECRMTGAAATRHGITCSAGVNQQFHACSTSVKLSEILSFFNSAVLMQQMKLINCVQSSSCFLLRQLCTGRKRNNVLGSDCAWVGLVLYPIAGPVTRLFSSTV